MTEIEWKNLSNQARVKIIELSAKFKVPHLGSALSCIDSLLVAYFGGYFNVTPENPEDPKRDRIILSKGHAAKALYVSLAMRGFFGIERLEEFTKAGGPLAEHPGPKCMPGVEAATGSLGHGLGLGVGVALGNRIQKIKSKVAVVMSDGECNEGSVWEAALLAPRHGLGELSILIDYNKWQATGRSNEIMQLESLAAKWRAFGWHVDEVDGHKPAEILAAIKAAPTDKPRAFVCHTVKGKGVSFMEDDNNWHYRIPTEDEVKLARRELLEAP